MAAITFLREKKWIITGFSLLGIGLLLISTVPAIYQVSQQGKDLIFVEGKYYRKETYKDMLKKCNYNSKNLQQHLRQERISKKILQETNTYVTSDDVKAIMYNPNDKIVQEVINEQSAAYRGGSVEDIEKQMNEEQYKEYIKQIKKPESAKQRRQYEQSLKKKLEKKKAMQFLNESTEKKVILKTYAEPIRITARRINLGQIITEQKKATLQEKRDYLAENKRKFSTDIMAKVLYQPLFIASSHQEIKDAEEKLNELKEAFETNKDPDKYAKRHSDSSKECTQKWDIEKVPHFLKGKPIGYVSSPKKYGDQYRMYRVKNPSKDGKFVVYQITKNIEKKAYFPHTEKRVEAIKNEHRTQSHKNINKKYGYYYSSKKKYPQTFDITPDMVNLPPNTERGAIARKIFNEKYKRGQYFSINMKDEKSNDVEKLMVCTLLERGQGDALDYNQKKIKESIQAKNKHAQIQKDFSQLIKGAPGENVSIEDRKRILTEKYGQEPWIDQTIKLEEDCTLYGFYYPEAFMEIIQDKSPPPFYSFLDEQEKNIIIVIVKGGKEAELQQVQQKPQKPEDRLTQYNVTNI